MHPVQRTFRHPFGAPQYQQTGNFGTRGKTDKCTFSAGGFGSGAWGWGTARIR